MDVNKVAYLYLIMFYRDDTYKHLFELLGVDKDEARYYTHFCDSFKNRNLGQLCVDYPEITQMLIDFYLLHYEE